MVGVLSLWDVTVEMMKYYQLGHTFTLNQCKVNRFYRNSAQNLPVLVCCVEDNNYGLLLSYDI